MYTNCSEEIKHNLKSYAALKKNVTDHMREFPNSDEAHLSELNSSAITVSKLKDLLEYHTLCLDIINKQIQLKDKQVVNRINNCIKLNDVLYNVLQNKSQPLHLPAPRSPGSE